MFESLAQQVFFSLPVNFQCRLSYGVCAAPICNHLQSFAICARIKDNNGSHTTVWTYMKTLHTLIEMGSAALAAAVPYTGKAIQISCMGQQQQQQQQNLKHLSTVSQSLPTS